MTWYSILHGPEVWLAIAGLCGLAIVAGAIGFVIFAFWEDDDEHRRGL